MPADHFQRAVEAMARAQLHYQTGGDVVLERADVTWHETQREEARAALRALLAILPEIGWRLVPVEPTSEMLVAADAVPHSRGPGNLLAKRVMGHCNRYAAMLASAPSFEPPKGDND